MQGSSSWNALRRSRTQGGASSFPSPVRGSYRFVLAALGLLTFLSWFSFSDLLRTTLQYSNEAGRSALGQIQHFQQKVIPSTIPDAISRAQPETTTSTLVEDSTPKKKDVTVDAISPKQDWAFPGRSLKLVTEDRTMTTSAAHCSLSTMNDKAWEGAMCSYKMLCYDPTANEFVFYRAIPEIAPPATAVNLGKFSQLMPKVKDGALPLPRYEAADDETWVITEMNDKSTEKLEDFVRDDLFAWWLVAQHATWGDLKTELRPLSTGEIKLTKNMRQWYNAMPFGPLTYISDLQKMSTDGYPICFPRAVAGTGSMSDHCLAPDHDFHELKRPLMGVGVESIPCATGRGPLFYRIREEMIAKLLGKRIRDLPPRATTDQHLILFAEEENENKLQDFESDAKVRFPSVSVRRLCVSCLSVQEQLELSLQISVFVTKPTGPQSLAAHFLRKGAGIILFEPHQKSHSNFGLWNNLGYVRARWVQNPLTLLDNIAVELEKSQQFM